ncbi:hypothetical protein GMOD_00006588 [Pyrenophora seminiperda CCB06]|uniref:Uncharacterized protein n=1 Tax=Pyrenophora seminiperda CCB06 TaxID=1302712 RepID=A0A3M7MAB9_9PLEO|nr:hypothetical protein GMOD_00006588 [Pyrenophora seminiperda CCB06]
MTAKLGTISAPLVALIAVAGIATLIGLVVLIALLLDVPKRKERKNNRGILSVEEMRKKSTERDDDAEKGGVEVAVTVLPTVKSMNSLYQGSEDTLVPTVPEKCRCKRSRKG